MLKIAPNISDICRAALKAEFTGNFESGLIELAEFWDYRLPDAPPDISGLSKNEIGELLLRCGALYGFYGISKKELQEKSKDLITEAFSYFDETKNTFRQRECANYLALAYSRMGNKSNTEAWLHFSFDHPEIDYVYLHALIIESIVNLNAGDFAAAVRRLEFFEPNFKLTRNIYLQSCFYTNLGLAQKNLERFDAALENLLTGRDYFTKIDHKPYLASLENNIARLYQKKGNIKKSLEHSVRGLAITEELGDLYKMGGILDTMAQISFDQKAFPLALHYAEKAVAALEQTEYYAYLIEALETKIRCLVRLGRVEEALDGYARAFQFGERETGSGAVNARLRTTLATELREICILKIYREGGQLQFLDGLALTFAEEMNRPEGKISIVETGSNRLSEYGIEAGDMLVVESADISAIAEGDLIALKLRADGSAFYGFYFADWETKKIHLKYRYLPHSRVFDVRDVILLGRVVGFARFQSENQRSLRVVPLEI